jgi:hypothetical protein
MIRGRVIERPKVAAYLKRKRKTEDEILAAAGTNPQTPDYIKLEYRHAEVSSANSLLPIQQLDVSPLSLTTPSAATLHSAYFSNQSTRLPTPEPYRMQFDEPSLVNFRGQRELRAVDLQEVVSRSRGGNRPGLPSSLASDRNISAAITALPDHAEASHIFSQLDSIESYNNVIEQMLSPDSPAGPVSNELNMYRILSGSRQVSCEEELIRDLDSEGGISNNAAEGTKRRHGSTDLSQKFLVYFFRGCMLYSQDSPEGAASPFRHARKLFEAMVRGCHPNCLAALNVMLSVLEAHGRNHLAFEFLSVVQMFTPKDPTNPVAATVEFLVRIATRRLKPIEMEIADLQSIHEQLKDQFGAESPSALVGLYHVAWMCAKESKHRERALQTLTGLVPSAREKLGPSHFLTITCMTTMARVLSYIRTVDESISLMGEAHQAIELTHAYFHPFRLEFLYRLSLFLIDAHQPTPAARILKEVVELRCNVLGPGNDLTTRSLELLQEALELSGKNVCSKELASEMLSPSKVNENYKASPLKAYLPVASPT